MFVLLRRVYHLLLRTGHVPKHVAFIMDGNRRYAKTRNQEATSGHVQGYKKLIEAIHWCIELGVEHISVYAFSIENFKRSPDEVCSLMRLAEDKYVELSQDKGLAEREGIKMLVIGDLSLAPEGVRNAAKRLMDKTASIGKKRATLNICFCYTSTEDLLQAAASIRASFLNDLERHVSDGGNCTNTSSKKVGCRSPDPISVDVHVTSLPDEKTPGTGAATSPVAGPQIDRSTLEAAFHSRESPPVDLLIRTSGETRLSDFMTWQCATAHICILDTLWPDMSFTDFGGCILEYQRHADTMHKLRSAADRRLSERLRPVAWAGGGGGDANSS